MKHGLLFLILLASFDGVRADSSRIRARVEKTDGSILSGLIRWDRNEASWFDVLDGSRELSPHNRESAERLGVLEQRHSREVRVFGIRLFSWESGEDFPRIVQSGIRFGHLKVLEPLGDTRARLTLRSREELVLFGSSDIGTGVRKVIVESPDGNVELDWKEIERMEFEDFDVSSEQASAFGDRLYGTVIAESGIGFQGYVCWDIDEIFSTDILDGKEKGTDRKVPFSEILSVEKVNSGSVRIRLRSGEEMVLSGSNDVNEDNRGILVLDPGIGQVRLDWGPFQKLVLQDPPLADLKVFDGGRKLQGRVETESGVTHRGHIRWDNDEEFTWELLDGSYGKIEFDVELGLIRMIERRSDQSAVVTLLDGRSFELTGSNDVGVGHKGVFVVPEEGPEIAVEWDQFFRAVFEESPTAPGS